MKNLKGYKLSLVKLPNQIETKQNISKQNFKNNSVQLKIYLYVTFYTFQYKEYLSEDEAKQLLYDRETWMQCKNALWTRMTAKIPHSVLSNR